ncbi:MAG TPA: outer membrane beta-barrel protein [Kofleriaceae bacterium]|jgi:outer membrane protein W
MSRLPFISTAACLLLCLASTAHAEDHDGKGLRLRAWTGAVGRYVLTDNEQFDSGSDGMTSMSIDSSTYSVGIGAEYKFFRWLGVEGSVAYMRPHVTFQSSVDTAPERAGYTVFPAFLSLNVHPITNKYVDLWFGPQIAYVSYPDDLTFHPMGAPAFQYKSENSFSAVGFTVGADVNLDPTWALNFAFRFQDSDGDADGQLTYDPTLITAGLTAKM